MTDLLRICTAGSVDDGKSTLIGRLLYDSRAVYEDQLHSVRKASKNRTAGPIDFSLFTDGLRAEREQGITIDVAYRYFATTRRKFILADTPGHEQYTRNMRPRSTPTSPSSRTPGTASARSPADAQIASSRTRITYRVTEGPRRIHSQSTTNRRECEKICRGEPERDPIARCTATT